MENKTRIIAERVKAIAIAFIGAIFLSLGPGYFSEQSSYRVPRILWPVFKIFGNVGLAIGLLVLGAIMLFWAYSKFVKHGGKKVVMLVLIPVFIAGGFGLAQLSVKKTAAPDKTASDIAEAGRPALEDRKANEYLDKLEHLLVEMTKSKEVNNKAAFDSLDKEYTGLNSMMAELIPVLSKTEQYRDFILYNAKVSKQIDKLRGIE